MKLLVAAVTLIVVSPACGTSSPVPVAAPGPASASGPVSVVAAGTQYSATIRWTEYGVPHIEAAELGSLSFGQGYAFASLHLCVLAEQVVKVKGERARYFGAGPGDANIDSDFGFRGLGFYKDAADDWLKASTDTKAITRGFVGGYNHYLSKTAPAKLPAACRDAPWLRPLTEVDLVAYGRSVAMLASGTAFASSIGSAKPRRGKSASNVPTPRATGLASNGWAIGSELSVSGGGMVVANPHFPWEGPRKFYESHLTIPGDLDVYGANLMGMPLISIGFTKSHGWTHTFSAARRFAVYRIKLDPKDPTRYLYGGETRKMTSVSHSIAVKQTNGTLATVERRLYHTHYGAMIDGKRLRWDADAGIAYTLFDAARDNVRALDQYLAMIRAKDVAGFKNAFSTYQSTPFVNTMYAHRSGATFYIDGSRVPNISAKAMAMWRLGLRMIPALKAAYDAGLVVLDGSNPAFEPAQDATAVAKGIVSFANAPKLDRRDYVFNSNDSYWVANGAATTAAASPFYGARDVALSARSRMNLTSLSDTGDDGRFDTRELERLFLSNRGFLAEQWKDAVAKRCLELVRTVSRSAGRKAKKPRDNKHWRSLLGPCEALAAWDGRTDLDSKGAVLWREFVTGLGANLMGRSELFSSAFDPAKPAVTPRGLAPKTAATSSHLMQVLVQAAGRLRQAGHDPSAATLRALQFTEVTGTRIAVSGGLEREGVLNKASYRSPRATSLPTTTRGKVLNQKSGLTARGYPINDGSSFVMIVEWTAAGPSARGIMTYGASSDRASPLAAQQFSLWQNKKLRPMKFARTQIDASPELRVETIRGGFGAASTR